MHLPGAPPREDASSKGRAEIRRIVAEEFAIDEVPGFSRLRSGEQELLRGLLAVDPDRRGTAQRALTAAMQLASAERVRIPEPRPPSPVPAIDAAADATVNRRSSEYGAWE